MKRGSLKLAVTGIVFLIGYAAFAAWTIDNPTHQEDVPYNEYLQTAGKSEIASGVIAITAGAPEPTGPWEIDTTLMTEANGDWSGGIGDGSWDYLGLNYVVIYD